MSKIYHVGIDIGSTTIKVVILNSNKELIYSKYERHYADIKGKLEQIISNAYKLLRCASDCYDYRFGGMGIAKSLDVAFTRSNSTTKAIKTYHPETDVAIELGEKMRKLLILLMG